MSEATTEYLRELRRLGECRSADWGEVDWADYYRLTDNGHAFPRLIDFARPGRQAHTLGET